MMEGNTTRDQIETDLSINTLLDDSDVHPIDEDAARLIVVDQSSYSTQKMSESPDHILNSYGALNPYILVIFILLSIIWGVAAMPMMASAFLLGDACTSNMTNCTATPGSISEEFDLIGTRSKFSDMTSMAFLFGNALGSSPVSHLSDNGGRRAALVICLMLYGIFGLLTCFSSNVFVFMLLRLLQGTLFSGCGVINWIHAYENSPMSLRKYAALIFGLMWIVGYCILAPISYYFSTWRFLMIFASLPSLLFGILFYFVLPDSFHFMITKGRTSDLRRWITLANRVSKNPRLDLNAELIISAHRNAQHGSEANSSNIFSELVKKRTLLIYTLIFGYLWSADSFIYYGISLVSTLLSGAGSKYWSYALTGLVEIPSYIASPILLNVLGRRMTVVLSHILTAIAFIGIVFVENPTLVLILWLVGKFGISVAFTSLFVYASEVFPTVFRSSLIGICIVLARVAGTFAPLIRLMATINPNMPNILFIIIASTGGIFTLLLPETKNQELPDSISEVVASPEYLS